MGCISIRDTKCKEEKAMMRIEQQLEYYKHSCVTVDKIIRKYSNDDSVSLLQWDGIVASLDIKAANSTIFPYAEKYYQYFLKDNSFNRKDLLFIGILLSTGIPRQKARLLFEIYDINCEKVISVKDIISIINSIAIISINVYSTLVDKQSEESDEAPKLTYYSEKLSNHIDEAKKRLVDEILLNNESITLATFINFFDNANHGKLLYPHGFRNYLASFING